MKQVILKLLRATGFFKWADNIRFIYHYCKNYFSNALFKAKHRYFVFPPAYYLYETYALSCKDYYTDGKQTAEDIAVIIRHYFQNTGSISIMDWGCGPARVIRHFPEVLPGMKYFGIDYNAGYIAWCSKNIPRITFVNNKTNPPINLPDQSVDIIYSLSILTHLSEQNHYDWIAELYRLLKPGGIVIITTQGDCFTNKLLSLEMQQYHEGNLVVREFSKEGHRLYSSFQPPAYMYRLLGAFKVLEHIPGNTAKSIHGAQDTWVGRKNT